MKRKTMNTFEGLSQGIGSKRIEAGKNLGTAFGKVELHELRQFRTAKPIT